MTCTCEAAKLVDGVVSAVRERKARGKELDAFVGAPFNDPARKAAFKAWSDAYDAERAAQKALDRHVEGRCG